MSRTAAVDEAHRATARHDWPAPGEVHVWPVELTQALLPEHVSGLDDVERARLLRLRNVKAQAQFAQSHATLRALLGAYLGVAPQAVALTANGAGKPCLTANGMGKRYLAGSGDLRFNLAHTDGLVVFAFAFRREVGVDCERLASVDTESLLAVCAAPAERAAWATAPAALRELAFYRGWSRKEAVLKAWGDGFGIAPQQVPVSMSPLPGQQVVVAAEALARPPCRWIDLTFSAGWVGAVALVGEAGFRIIECADAGARQRDPPGGGAVLPRCTSTNGKLWNAS
jgi:4'-phosphopantetheinyl transferase